MRKGQPGSAEDLLRRLGRGEIELTHEAFHTLQPWRAAAHLRELLMTCGILPRIDKQICLFERWLLVHLDTITDPGHAQLIQRFATWNVLPRLRARAATTPIPASSRQFAGARAAMPHILVLRISGVRAEADSMATNLVRFCAVHTESLE
jgi:hypothetical protein